MEVLSLDECLVTNFEVRCWSPLGIHRSLVSLLAMDHLPTEEFMQGVEVNGVLMSSSRGQVAFRMDGKVGVVTFVSKEW